MKERNFKIGCYFRHKKVIINNETIKNVQLKYNIKYIVKFIVVIFEKKSIRNMIKGLIFSFKKIEF